MKFLAFACALSASASSAPTPCGVPAGILPAVPEGLCYKELVPKNPSGISIRSYTTANTNATFVSSGGNGAFPSGLQGAVAGVISYFSGNNDEQRNILAARTVPFVIQPPGQSGAYWSASMEVSPTQFPDDFLIPRPSRAASLSKVSGVFGTTLFAVFQYNTTGFPYLENIQEACMVIQNSTLPSGYIVNTTNPFSPTYVFYNGQADAQYTSECWMAVYQE